MTIILDKYNIRSSVQFLLSKKTNLLCSIEEFIYHACKFILIIGLLFSQAACQEQGSETAKLVQTFKLPYYPTKVAWHPDGKKIAVVGMGGILSVFDTVTGQPVKTPDMWASSFSVAYSPNGRFLALQKSTNNKQQDYPAQSLMLLDANNHAVVYESEANKRVQYRINAFDPSGRYMVVTGEPVTGDTFVFDTIEKKPIAKLVPAIPAGWGSEGINHVVFSPDGSIVITGCISGALNVFSTKDWHLVKTFKAHKGYVLSMAISPDGKWLATGGNSGDVRQKFDPVTRAMTEIKYDDPIKMWDMTSWEQVKALPIRNKHTTSLAFSSDSTHLVSAAQENILFWDVQAEKQTGAIKGFKGGSALSFALSQDGEHLAVVGTGSSEVQVWKISSQSTINREK